MTLSNSWAIPHPLLSSNHQTTGNKMATPITMKLRGRFQMQVKTMICENPTTKDRRGSDPVTELTVNSMKTSNRPSKGHPPAHPMGPGRPSPSVLLLEGAPHAGLESTCHFRLDDKGRLRGAGKWSGHIQAHWGVKRRHCIYPLAGIRHIHLIAPSQPPRAVMTGQI